MIFENKQVSFGLSALAALAALTAPALSASAQSLPAGSTEAGEPPSAGVAFASYASPRDLLKGRDALERLDAGTIKWTARVAYADGEIYNPATGRMDNVRLRSYQGEGVDPNNPFMPPTLYLRPGDTLRLNLINELPADDPSCIDHGDINIPHCFNKTNMHTHGFWVSPAGNSDNITFAIPPGNQFTYEYNVPSDHPAGTFWYHPHVHGSTALQVSSGMGGALIVRGERLPTPETTGDIDTLLRTRNGEPLAERVVMLTQIAYACGPRLEDGSIDIKEDEDGFWICDDDDVGMIEGYNQFGMWENFDTPTGVPEVAVRWQRSGRHTALNGRVIPTFTGVTAGEIQRWRLIQGGVSGSISMSFRKYTGDAPDQAYRGGDEGARDAFVGDNCNGEEVSQFSIALDGLTRSRVNEQRQTMLHPGYRDDVLIAFPEPGVYCIVDNDAPRNENIRMQEKQRQLLGYVVVDSPRRVHRGGPLRGKTQRTYVQDFLVDAADRHMPDNVRDRISGELADDTISLASFVAHTSLLDAEVDGTQTLGFDTFIVEDAPQNEFVVGDLELIPGALPQLINASDYQAGRIDRQLTLDHIEEWTLAAFTEGHPFHKHVNPVQIVSIIDPDTGLDVSEFGSGSVYAGLKGQWKDTVFLPTNLFGAPFVVTVRTHYRRYIGTFVLHCHILDHEDFGMMQVLTISMGEPSGGHSGHGGH